MNVIRRANSAPMEYRRSETDPMIKTEFDQDDGEDDYKEPEEKEKPKRSRQPTDTTEMLASTASMMMETSADQGTHGNGGNGWGRGIIADIKRTLGTHWKGEMTNFNQQTVAVSFFLFFACIAPAISKFPVAASTCINDMESTLA